MNLVIQLRCVYLPSIDDATGKNHHAEFDFNEGVIPVFNFWMACAYFGKPLSIYIWINSQPTRLTTNLQ